MTNPNDPAHFTFTPLDDEGKAVLCTKEGLTKREHFASLAMAALISSPRLPIGGEKVAELSAELYAGHALTCADALINALNRQAT